MSTVASQPRSPVKSGSIYLGGTGMLTWLLHRISGIAVVYFLTLHIFEALQLFGGVGAYNEATEAYKQLWFRPFEMALVLAVVYHALNGLRVWMFDAFPQTTKHHRTVFKIGVVIFGVIALAVAVVMLRPLFGKSLAEIFAVKSTGALVYALAIALPVALPVLYIAWRGSGLASGPMLISQSSSRPAPMKNGFERFMWQFMRLSGLLMVVLVFFHLTIMHFTNDIEQITGQFVATRFAATPLWIILDLAILVLAWFHGLNGLRIVLMDYVKRSGARRIVFGAIGLFGLVWFGAGAAVLFYVQQNAAAMLK
ncbi:MAG TPA: succinate dehydrogenase, cytochrome b556 subunit [Anaerolineae bacterium]|nr:succinate dehydrogenase, cytochrome b556 subunit [Anaerolineae bacterium]